LGGRGARRPWGGAGPRGGWGGPGGGGGRLGAASTGAVSGTAARARAPGHGAAAPRARRRSGRWAHRRPGRRARRQLSTWVPTAEGGHVLWGGFVFLPPSRARLDTGSASKASRWPPHLLAASLWPAVHASHRPPAASCLERVGGRYGGPLVSRYASPTERPVVRQPVAVRVVCGAGRGYRRTTDWRRRAGRRWICRVRGWRRRVLGSWFQSVRGRVQRGRRAAA